MDSSLQSSPGGNLEHKGGFRKPSTDTATRNYRKRSPVDRSPSSDGDPEHDRKKDDEKELRKDSDRSRYGKSGDSHRYNERNASRSYHGHEKFSDGDQRTRQYDHSKSRDKDKYSRDRYESSGHRSKDREKEAASSEKFRDKRGREDRGDKRDYQRSSRNHWSSREIEESITADRANSRDHAKGHVKERDVDDSNFLREKSGRVGKSLDDKGVPDRDQKSPSKKSRFTSYGGPDFVKSSSDEKKQESLEGNGKPNPGQVHGANDLNAAKFAAMKAAELVNQNLGGGAGFMSTEQKKKLLWGNKKSSVATEESARQWDVSSIGDPERQEKFNKLMGVKGGSGISKEVGSSIVTAEKHKELQMDLEKQYTAGLRRRDGRTVGLGL